MPLSAFFSASAWRSGRYARSWKEGQYYLMPLFLVTMPLIFLTLAPGVELNAFYSLVPVTGVALLMQRLVVATSWSQVPWLYFVPVLGPMAMYGWLALRWAIEQFQREEVLFREAEALGLATLAATAVSREGAAAQHGPGAVLLQPDPGTARLSLGLGGRLPPEVHAVIVSLAFVAAPPLFMGILLNTLPRVALYLRGRGGASWGWPWCWRSCCCRRSPAAQAAYGWFPQQADDPHPLAQLLARAPVASESRQPGPRTARQRAGAGRVRGDCVSRVHPDRAAAPLSAAQRDPRQRRALCPVSSQRVPVSAGVRALGVVLGLLTLRSRSLLPAVLFHFLHNAILVLATHFSQEEEGLLPDAVWLGMVAGCALAAVLVLWWLYRLPYVGAGAACGHQARRQAMRRRRCVRAAIRAGSVSDGGAMPSLTLPARMARCPSRKRKRRRRTVAYASGSDCEFRFGRWFPVAATAVVARHRVALFIQHIRDRLVEGLFAPEVTCAAVLRPPVAIGVLAEGLA